MLTVAEIKQFIDNDMTSSKKQYAKVAQRYYDAEHDIAKYRIFYFNADGQLVEDKNRSNIRISHAFFTELVDQKSQYALSKKEDFVLSDIPELQEELNKYFDDDFMNELSDCVTDASITGYSYMYARVTSEDVLDFSYSGSSGIIEVRAKETQDGCDYVIYWYIDRRTSDNKDIKRIQVWDTNATTYYVMSDDGKIELDEDEEINPRPHILVDRDGELYERNMGYIPFFRLDNNRKQTSDLKPVKMIIDDYDMVNCGLSNNIQDNAEAIYIVKGYEGDNLDELQHNLKTKKIVGVDTEGGMEAHTVDIPFQARKEKMEIDEKNIYKFGMGFNSAQIGDGNITNIVIKSRYALLDLKCDKFEKQLRKFLKQIIRVVLSEINEKNGTAYTETDVYFDLTREVMTNALDNATIEKTVAETEQIRITTILNAATTLQDKETVIKAICDILDINYEDIKDKIDLTTPEDDVTNAETLLGGDDIE